MSPLRNKQYNVDVKVILFALERMLTAKSGLKDYIWEKYGRIDYRLKVSDYIKKEDTSGSLNYQTRLMK